MKWITAIVAGLLAVGMLTWKLCFPSRGAAMRPPLLLNQWEEQVYSLDAHEDVRLIPPPFSSQRSGRFSLPTANSGAAILQAQYMLSIIDGRIAYTASSSGKGTVSAAFMWCARFYGGPGIELPVQLGHLPVDGDWIVRYDAPLERRMKALESILSGSTGRTLSIQRPTLERDVIIARGTWAFHPSDDPRESKFYLANPAPRLGGSGTLADSFASLERELGRKIIDETEEPRPSKIYWKGSLNFSRISDSSRTEILASLEKQTSLRFIQTRRAVPVWIVSEKEHQP